MGMFDSYEPVPPLACVVCGQPLSEWQGKHGPCALFVWRQGCDAPIRQEADEDCRLSHEELAAWRLPTEFWIGSRDCGCPYENVAIGRTEDGVWVSTELITAQNASQGTQTRAEWKAYLKWLRGEHKAKQTKTPV